MGSHPFSISLWIDVGLKGLVGIIIYLCLVLVRKGSLIPGNNAIKNEHIFDVQI